MSNLQKTKFAVIGGGSWATAIVKLLCNSQSKVGWWMRNENAVLHIQQFKHNPNYLHSVEFDITKLSISSNLEKIISNSEIVIIATPAAFLTKTFENLPTEFWKNKSVFSAVNGIIPETNLIPAEFIHQTFMVPFSHIGIICGPCHAEEVAMERLSYLTIGCSTDELASEMSVALACRYIKTTISDDLIGA